MLSLEKINNYLKKHRLQMDFLSFLAVLFNCTLILIYLYEYSIVSLTFIAGVVITLYMIAITGVTLYFYDKKNPLANIIWLLCLFMGLGFLPVYATIISGGKKYLLLNLLSSLLILAIIVDWLFFMLISFVGIFTAYLFCLIYYNNLDLHIFHPSKKMYFITYLVSYTFIAISLFSRQKEKKHARMLDFMKVFGGAIAHEVKAPLATINMLASTLDLILSQAKLVKNQDQYLLTLDSMDYNMLENTIKTGLIKASAEAIQIVEMLLTTVRNSALEESKKELLSEIAIAAVKMAEELHQKKIKLIVIHDFQIHCSKTLLKQVIYNLIKNSLKHGGPEVEIEVVIDQDKIEVIDNGLGIESEVIKKIFDSFITNGKGHGIGLAFCNYVLEGIDASLTCQSQPKVRTIFTINFNKK
jgi:signal transduction histidine kinase